MGNIKLYRRRFIPDELVFLKDDEIISIEKGRILTRWKTIKPRADFTHGISCYFIDEGFKISRFFDSNGVPLYWYCDIIDTVIKDNEYIFNDLLIDIKVYDDKTVKVIDLDEIGQAIRNDILDKEMTAKAVEQTDRLLKIIYNGRFGEYIRYINEVL